MNIKNFQLALLVALASVYIPEVEGTFGSHHGKGFLFGHKGSSDDKKNGDKDMKHNLEGKQNVNVNLIGWSGDKGANSGGSSTSKPYISNYYYHSYPSTASGKGHSLGTGSSISYNSGWGHNDYNGWGLQTQSSNHGWSQYGINHNQGWGHQGQSNNNGWGTQGQSYNNGWGHQGQGYNNGWGNQGWGHQGKGYNNGWAQQLQSYNDGWGHKAKIETYGWGQEVKGQKYGKKNKSKATTTTEAPPAEEEEPEEETEEAAEEEQPVDTGKGKSHGTYYGYSINDDGSGGAKTTYESTKGGWTSGDYSDFSSDGAYGTDSTYGYKGIKSKKGSSSKNHSNKKKGSKGNKKYFAY
ncbi:unnamed protein product [Allacma fusca]|uniref:Uncharacterized protein n=1 Tax=Allacma fusca TaxID=39272 RepID=A0A8J2PNS5_9HEXA|nr:unnamed protein product [Allacma fusca]